TCSRPTWRTFRSSTGRSTRRAALPSTTSRAPSASTRWTSTWLPVRCSPRREVVASLARGDLGGGRYLSARATLPRDRLHRLPLSLVSRRHPRHGARRTPHLVT